ncbi:MAG TPA: FHA domain-containing protein, partial [Ktedonobacterales bacterium]
MPGATRATLLIMTADGTQPPQRVQPTKGPLTVGRDSSNDIVLADPTVSRHHLTLAQRGAGWRVTRAPEAGPMYLNGQACVSADLRPGDQLALGGMVLRQELPADDPLAAVLPPGPARTIIAAEPVPTLRVESPGGRFVVPLRAPRLTLGRAATCELIIPSRVVSTQHATLERGADGAYTLLADERARNPFTADGVPVRRRALRPGETLLIGSRESGEYATITYAAPATLPTAPAPTEGVSPVELPRGAVAVIGRDPASDYCLPNPLVSWRHAQLSRDATGGVTLEDLDSTNGTYVNLSRITQPHRLAVGDVVQIGPYHFTFDGARLQLPEEPGPRVGLRLEALDLVRTVHSGQTTLLDHVSVTIEPGQFVTIIGGNGAGKTTLLRAMAGIQPAQQGVVLIGGVDSYQHYELFRGRIGYVPQADIVHLALTVEEALSYTARLRLPPDLRDDEIAQRIQLVLAEVDLSPHQHKLVGSLSGGERKRLSLAVELLAEPQVLFLDEPNAALDPNHRLELLRTVRELAKQGRTLLMVTHFREDFEASDRVVVMGRGGRICFYGSPSEVLSFFGVGRFEDVYTRIEEATDAQAWRKRYQQLSAAPPVRAAARQAPARGESTRQGWNPATSTRHISAARQLRLLLSRYARILSRDRINVAILLLQAPVIGLILALVSTSSAFTSANGPSDALQVLFFLALVAVWFGTSNSVREISKEGDIYQRERLAGLRIIPYVFSKVGILAILCFVQ